MTCRGGSRRVGSGRPQAGGEEREAVLVRETHVQDDPALDQDSVVQLTGGSCVTAWKEGVQDHVPSLNTGARCWLAGSRATRAAWRCWVAVGRPAPTNAD